MKSHDNDPGHMASYTSHMTMHTSLMITEGRCIHMATTTSCPQ